jgi:hypothetical protein
MGCIGAEDGKHIGCEQITTARGLIVMPVGLLHPCYPEGAHLYSN